MFWDRQGYATCTTSSSKNPHGSKLLRAPTNPKVKETSGTAAAIEL